MTTCLDIACAQAQSVILTKPQGESPLQWQWLVMATQHDGRGTTPTSQILQDVSTIVSANTCSLHYSTCDADNSNTSRLLSQGAHILLHPPVDAVLPASYAMMLIRSSC